MLTINLLEYIQLSIERMTVLFQYETFLYFPCFLWGILLHWPIHWTWGSLIL